MQHRLITSAFAATLVLAAATPILAQQDRSAASQETAFLRSFEGQFTGTGKLQRAGGTTHTLTCKLNGDHQGAQVVLNGSCSTALVFGTSVRIEIRYDPGSRRYEGAFREGKGTVAALAGARQGQTLSFSFTETQESVRPDPPARLSIHRGADDLVLTLRGTKPDQGRNLDLMLRET
jgi:uncharacterized membrane protein